MYQRRWGKGGLFMTCILGTFFYGLWLGGGRVVYASFREGDSHYAFLCQVGVGLPALPVLVQAQRMGSNPPKAPWLDGIIGAADFAKPTCAAVLGGRATCEVPKRSGTE